ncbi:MAG: hypothetical protein JNL11_04075 [Bdellovibrionaceae bacterium]|nr:hypothetical protein [Pseudobdellovibrionaceae bacterium]
MNKFSYKTTDEINFTNVLLEGPINETFAVFDYRPNRDKSVRFDFQKVTTINSMGIRYWISWLHRNPGTAFHFRNCPVCIVDQINNVSDFMPSGTTVESFYVPYYSEHTGEEKHDLYILKKDYNLGQVAKIKEMNDSQGNKMEIDIYPQKYFKFLLK